MAVPTVPIINRGPQLFEKQRVISASSFVNLWSVYSVFTTFAPIGYPAIRPVIKAKKLCPGRCQSFLVIGELRAISFLRPSSGTRILMKIINGSREGSTLLNQSNSPF